MKKPYQIKVTVMADSENEAMLSVRINPSIRGPLQILEVECDHEWKAYRTVTFEERAPAIVRYEWMDIPDGLDGDYALIRVVNPWRDGNMAWDPWTERQVSDLIAVCEKCGAKVEDGEKVS